jgi:hypothetical protein
MGPKEQILFLLFLSGPGQLHAYEDGSTKKQNCKFSKTRGDFAIPP